MAIWLPELEGRRGPKYLRIVDALVEDIASGVLAPGTMLPPHRELAYQLGVSANTASRAYAEAVNRALLVGEVGRGTFVRAASGFGPDESAVDLARPRHGPVDLSRNLPHPGASGTYLAATLKELSAASHLSGLTDFQSDRGLPRHQAAAVEWLHRHGVESSPEHVVLACGAQHAIFAALMALTGPGDLILVEALTYAPVRAMAGRLGLKVASVALDAGGLVPEDLDRLCREGAPKVLYLTPTLQTPTGRTLSQDRRRQIAEIAHRHGLLLIEDDVFGMLYPAAPAPIVETLPDQTVYITGVSKCLAPGLRVGVAKTPERLTKAVQGAVSLSCWMVPPLMAEVAARWIETDVAHGLAEAQLTTASRRLDLAREILAPVFGSTLQSHGFHAWLELPSEWSADRFCARAAERDVKVTNGEVFALSAREAPNAVRICLSHEPEEKRLLLGLTVLRETLEEGPAASDLVI
jgi:DNA-binding transcriptional MocR family regulator